MLDALTYDAPPVAFGHSPLKEGTKDSIDCIDEG